MVELLDLLGNPQRSFESVHVVGTKGKSTAARRIAATIGGLAYTSPHVSGWHERLQTDEAGFERAVQRVRAAAEELGATQFEVLTAAAFEDFAARGVKAAAVEAGLGGRLDATNVIDARVVAPHERRTRAHGGARRDSRGDRSREARRRPPRGGRRAARRGVCSPRAG